MKCMFTLLCLASFHMCAFGFDNKDSEFRYAVSNAASVICFDVQSKHSETCDKLRINIYRLKSQYATALIEYGWDSRVENVGAEKNAHIKDADELEKIRLVLDYKLKEMILIERLKSLNLQHSQLKAKGARIPRVCVDIDELIHKLSTANKVVFQKSTVDTGYEKETNTIVDKSKFAKLVDLLSSPKLNYDPKLCQIIREEAYGVQSIYEYDVLPSNKVLVKSLYSVSKSAELIIDDQVFVRIYPDSLVCRAKAYSFNAESEDDLFEFVESILSEKGVTH